ncbi:hypothetical protein EWM64_g5575 [Hericium alpestre]|uniref:Uncharacterized protein n=1 Tax=Hericium alpestre TaxID=135208 RepID=A0A4Y9ZWK5_9AGAM|nr:hypothetical protein EWM64_g5575 [Hericium alpestre]
MRVGILAFTLGLCAGSLAAPLHPIERSLDSVLEGAKALSLKRHERGHDHSALLEDNGEAESITTTSLDPDAVTTTSTEDVGGGPTFTRDTQHFEPSRSVPVGIPSIVPDFPHSQLQGKSNVNSALRVREDAKGPFIRGFPTGTKTLVLGNTETLPLVTTEMLPLITARTLVPTGTPTKTPSSATVTVQSIAGGASTIPPPPEAAGNKWPTLSISDAFRRELGHDNAEAE